MSESIKASDRVKELAAMSKLDYELIRGKEAKALGVRPGKLDEFVSESREPDTADIEEGIGNELMNGLEPWLKPVDGVEIADHIKATFNKHCSLPSGRNAALTLWCMAGYSINQFRIFPKACLSSPEKRCGKTTTLDVAAAFCNRSLLASNTSASVLFRAVDLWQPTMLMDECDTFIHGNDELRGIINSGHTRNTAVVWRIDGEGSNMMPKPFSTWSPILIAMIKEPPSTIVDRSIMINLKRKLVSYLLEKLPLDLSEDCKDTRQKCKRWSDDNAGLLRASNPDVPKISNDRAMDNWTPLLAVADAIGGQWSKLAKSAMMTIEDVCSDDQDGNYGVMSLEDIQVIFDNTKPDKIYTEDLIIQLNELEERPWCEYRNGQKMSARSLSKLLGSFGIKSGTIRINSGTKKATGTDA